MRHEMELSKSDRSLRIVRVDFGDGSLPLIGGWARGQGGRGGGGWPKWTKRLCSYSFWVPPGVVQASCHPPACCLALLIPILPPPVDPHPPT